MRRVLMLAVLVCAAAPVRLSPQAADPAAVAIIVNPQTKIDGVTFEELRSIFRGDRQFWPDGSRITLLVRAPVAAERKLVLDKIYRMTEDQFRQDWIKKMFRGEGAGGPKIVYSSEMAKDLVTAIPGAITFMPVGAAIPAGVKVLKI